MTMDNIFRTFNLKRFAVALSTICVVVGLNPGPDIDTGIPQYGHLIMNGPNLAPK